jgi:hypothetical protein
MESSKEQQADQLKPTVERLPYKTYREYFEDSYRVPYNK